MTIVHRPVAIRWSVSVLAVVIGACQPGATDDADRMELAKTAIARGEFGAASLELNNVIQANSKNQAARLLQGKVSIASGRMQAAERQLLEARELGVPDEEILLPLGHALIGQGEFGRVLSEISTESAALNARKAVAVLQGIAQLHRANYAAARQALDHALRLDPGFVDAQTAGAELARATGDTAGAIALMRRIVSQHPLSVIAHQKLGAMLFSSGRYAEAERSFINAIEADVDIDEATALLLARIGLAECQWRLGKRSLAIRNSKDLLDAYPWHPLPKYLRALLAFDNGDYDLASDYLRGVLNTSPGHKPSLQLLAAANFVQGNLGRAEMHLEDFFAAKENDPAMVRLLADTYLRMGNAAQAATTVEPLLTLLDQDPHLADLHATANLYAGNFGAGIASLRHAVKLEPTDLTRQMRLAAALLNNGEVASAEELMSRWPTIDRTERARGLLRLARFLRSDNVERATDYAKKLRRNDPSDLHALLALAEIAEHRGDRDRAIAWLEMARERNPAALEPRILLANYYARLGRPEAVVTVSQEALQEHPYNTTVLSILGGAQLELGNIGAALSTFREAQRMTPESVLSHLNLARAELAASDFWTAKDNLLRAAELDIDALGAIGSIIVEEFRRGNEVQAGRLAGQLQSRFPQNPAGFQIAGDIEMLDGNFAAALAAYQEASRRADSRLLTMKRFAAGREADLENANQPLQAWLAKNPDDGQVARILDKAADRLKAN